MSKPLYTEIKGELAQCVDPKVDESSLHRLTLLVMGIMSSQSAAQPKSPKPCISWD